MALSQVGGGVRPAADNVSAVFILNDRVADAIARCFAPAIESIDEKAPVRLLVALHAPSGVDVDLKRQFVRRPAAELAFGLHRIEIIRKSRVNHTLLTCQLASSLDKRSARLSHIRLRSSI